MERRRQSVGQSRLEVELLFRGAWAQQVDHAGNGLCQVEIDRLKVHPAGFTEPYPPRQVNSVYFDTHDYGAYAENLLGSSPRRKVRLRWYGDRGDPAAAHLEVKCRRNRLGRKTSFAAGDQDLDGVRWSEVTRRLRAQLPQDARIWLDLNPMPVLINSYLLYRLRILGQWFDCIRS